MEVTAGNAGYAGYDRIDGNDRQLYLLGLEYLKNNDSIKARYCFEKASQNVKFKNNALCRIIKLNLVEGKFKHARNLLEENKENLDIYLKKLYGKLECCEHNYGASKKYYEQCMSDPNMQKSVLFGFANLYMQTGNLDIARKIYETLFLMPEYKVGASLAIIALDILMQDYKRAEKEIYMMEKLKLSFIDMKRLSQADIVAKYYLGKLNRNRNENNYFKNLFFCENDRVLLNHISRHKNQNERDTNGCFFKYIDLESLLSDTREKIENLNPNRFGMFDIYQLKLDTPIGFKGEEITYDLCVNTLIGSKKIFTMYPVLLSDQFDQEGNMTSKELFLKRNGGK